MGILSFTIIMVIIIGVFGYFYSNIHQDNQIKESCIYAAKKDFQMNNPSCLPYIFFAPYDCECEEMICKEFSCESVRSVTFDLK